MKKYVFSYYSFLIFIIGILAGFFLHKFGVLTVKSIGSEIQKNYINLTLAVAAILSTVLAIRSNKRAEKLFYGQQKPLVQVRPIAIEKSDNIKVNTHFNIVNFSGFTAYNISFDLKYGDYDWCCEWINANRDNKYDNNIENAFYPVTKTIVNISKLKPGKTTSKYIHSDLNLEDIFTDTIKSKETAIKARWENKKGFQFEKIWYYDLEVTKVNDGISIDFRLKDTLSDE